LSSLLSQSDVWERVQRDKTYEVWVRQVV
jgi:hypothetical protein